MRQAITREEEQSIPEFNSHDEARKWFKGKYGNAFMLTEAEEIGDEKCFFYVLILDWTEYEKGQKEMEETGYISGTAYLRSRQSIQIMESGRVHIVH